MPRIIWLKLADGRNVITGYSDSIDQLLRRRQSEIVLTGEDGLTRLAPGSIRELTEVGPRTPLPQAAEVFNFAVH